MSIAINGPDHFRLPGTHRICDIVKSFMKKREVDIKDESLSIPVGQASRLSDNSWRWHLPHYITGFQQAITLSHFQLIT